MANYGAPGHGDPDPWHGRRPDEPYDPSAGRGGWEDPPQRGGGRPAAAPGRGSPPQARGRWEDPPQRRRQAAPVVAVLATVALLVLVGGAAVLFLLVQK